DDDVAELARVARGALEDLAAEDHATADSRTDERRDDVAIATPGPKPELRIAAHADVVLHQHGAIQRGRELRPERKILHVQVRAEKDHARVHIQRAGRGDAGRDDVLAAQAGVLE